MLRRIVVSSALLVAAVAPTACRTEYTENRRTEVEKGALIQMETVSYHIIESAHLGKVGYLKVKDVVEAGGHPYRWKFVYDLNFEELGFVDQYGHAFRFHPYPVNEQKIHKTPFRRDEMPVDSYENNVMRMLGIDPSTTTVTFPEATQADLASGS